MSPSNLINRCPSVCRKIDLNHRINIPKKMREALNLDTDSYLQVRMENDRIILEPMVLSGHEK